MNTAIWIVQIITAGLFAMAGSAKATQPREKLMTNMGWVEDFSANQVKIIGALEFLAALGLILPSVTGILPWLTPVAAVGLVLTMLGAMLTHARRGEYPFIVANLMLLLLAAFIAYGRLVAEPL